MRATFCSPTSLPKSLLCPDEGRHWWEEESLGLCMALPAFLSPANMALTKVQGCQTDFTPTPGLCVADRKDRSQPHIAAPVCMQLRQEQHSKLCIHTARKCLEVKLQHFPGPVQLSVEQLHQVMSKNPHAGSVPLPSRSPCVRSLEPKPLVHPDQAKQKEPGASITCPMASSTPLPSSALLLSQHRAQVHV